MTRPTQKQRERFFVEQAAKLLGKTWILEEDSENPDFFIIDDDKRFGLEVSELFIGMQDHAGSALKRVESDTQRRIEALRREYESLTQTTLRVQIVGTFSPVNIRAIVAALIDEGLESKPIGHHLVIDQSDGLRLHVIPTAALADLRRFPWLGFSDSLGAKEIRAMPSAVKLRDGYSAEELRALARRSKDANQSRRLLSLAAVRDGMERGEAAKIGGMDRQTLRDWVHRFNALGPDGLIDNRNASGPTTRLPLEQLREFAKLVEAGPDREVDGVVRWRRVDLKLVIAERFGVDYHERTVGKLLKKLGFSHMSARPRHPAQDERIVEAYKKTSHAR